MLRLEWSCAAYFVLAFIELLTGFSSRVDLLPFFLATSSTDLKGSPTQRTQRGFPPSQRPSFPQIYDVVHAWVRAPACVSVCARVSVCACVFRKTNFWPRTTRSIVLLFSSFFPRQKVNQDEFQPLHNIHKGQNNILYNKKAFDQQFNFTRHGKS